MRKRDLMLTQLASPVLVIGGAHAGKSQWAMQAMAPDRPGIVIGTADPDQLSQPQRIAYLQSLRPACWETREEFRDLPLAVTQAFESVDQVLVDSLNQWLAALVLEAGADDAGPPYEERLHQVLSATRPFLDDIATLGERRLVMVATEVGTAPPSHRPNERLYRQVVGLTLQHLAGIASTVVALQAGIPTLLKEPT